MTITMLAKQIRFNTLITITFVALLSACGGQDISNSIRQDSQNSEDTSSNANENKKLSDITLSWSAPSAREDNQPISLSEIAGYKLYYGNEHRKYLKKINIKDGSSNGYTVRNLQSGTYYFALTTYDTAGRESAYSAEIIIVV